MTQYPTRARSHELEAESDRFFRNHLPISWLVNKPVDYGLDYYIDIAENKAISGKNFSVQLKAHDKPSSNGEIIVTLKRTTINMYLNRLEPILLVCYIQSEGEAYYKWFTTDLIDLTKDCQEYNIKLEKAKKVSKLDWNIIVSDVNKIFSRRFLLNALPEIDFSKIPAGDETIAAGYYVKRDFERAEQAYKKLLLQETNISWLSALAMCQYSLYRYQEALININLAIEQKDYIGLWLNKASILAEDGIANHDKAKLMEACAIFKRAIGTLDDAHYYYNYANTLTELEYYDLAEANYKKALKKNPNYAEAWKNLGEIYFRTHRHDKERTCYEKALKINPDLPEALMTLGIFKLRHQEDANNALNLMARALEMQPDLFVRTSMGYYWFALANKRLNNETAFLSYLKKGLNHFPGQIYLLDLKRQYLKEHAADGELDNENYIEFLRYRLELNPSDLTSFVELADAYTSAGAIEAAILLIQSSTGLLPNISLSILENTLFPFRFYLSGLNSYREYANFRIQNSSKRYGHFYRHDITLPFIEFVSQYILDQGIKLIAKYRTLKNLEIKFVSEIIELAKLHYIDCAPFMITTSKADPKIAAKEVSEAVLLIPEMAIRESTLIIAYLATRFQLNGKKIETALNKTNEIAMFADIAGDCIIEIGKQHDLFGDDADETVES